MKASQKEEEHATGRGLETGAGHQEALSAEAACCHRAEKKSPLMCASCSDHVPEGHARAEAAARKTGAPRNRVEAGVADEGTSLAQARPHSGETMVRQDPSLRQGRSTHRKEGWAPLLQQSVESHIQTKQEVVQSQSCFGQERA